jgi:[NiFe] hydrogenase assembly HybE family chaperone
MICPDYLCEGLESVFRRIQRERMQGLPILNPELRVKAVGFRVWQGRCLGVLITPWFMNLMLLPSEGDDWQKLQVGDKRIHRLPAGPYEFILGEELEIGRYQVCSLFSPVFEFSDQETAEATAEAAMQALMKAENRAGLSTHTGEIEHDCRGESDGKGDSASEEREAAGEVTPTSLDNRLDRPLSRRDLLWGLLNRERRL